MRSALEILAGEARRRGTTYGKLVDSTSEEELGRIVHMAQLKDKLQERQRERGRGHGQGEEIQNFKSAQGSG